MSVPKSLHQTTSVFYQPLNLPAAETVNYLPKPDPLKQAELDRKINRLNRDAGGLLIASPILMGVGIGLVGAARISQNQTHFGTLTNSWSSDRIQKGKATYTGLYISSGIVGVMGVAGLITSYLLVRHMYKLQSEKCQLHALSPMPLQRGVGFSLGLKF